MSKILSSKQIHQLLQTLSTRFQKNTHRHPNQNWNKIWIKLEANPQKLWSLFQMEKSGGEPDVIATKSVETAFFDCSPESPSGRRSLCYDQKALESRKKHKPKDSAVNLAKSMGVDLLSEEQYRFLQELGEFDNKTSSWVQTPKEIREIGGAIFCDRRYNTVFTYHNGAESYYAARGFRTCLKI